MVRPLLIQGVGGLLWLLLTLPVSPLLAQHGAADRTIPRPIAEARRDADYDTVPDRLGDTLMVAGYATVGSGVLHTGRLQVFLQDRSGAIALYDDTIPRPIARGDSLVVIGVVEQQHGLTRLRPLYYYSRPPRAAPPAPLPVTLGAIDETLEGRLIEVTGRVLITDHTQNGGQYLTLMDPHGGLARLHVYAEPSHGSGVDLRAYPPGDVFRMVGLLGQFDRDPPFDAGYQLLLRSPDDVALQGLSNRLRRQLTYGVLLALILALGGMVLLRDQVIRRTRQLAETDRRFRTIYEGVLDIILVVDPTRRIVRANPEACRVLGYTEAELQKRRLDDLLDEGESLALPAPEDGPTDLRFETRLRTRTHDRLHVAGRVNRIRYEGAPQWLLVLHDITRHKQAEADLIAARDRAEELNRLKSAFLANMSHEVRTPMNGVIGIASLLERTPLTPEQQEYVSIIRHSGNALLHLLDDILDFSKIEADQVTIERHPFSVRACLEEALDMVTLRATRKGLRLAYILAAGVPPTVAGDVTRLRQVLVNLLSNAVKFTEEGEVAVYATVEEEQEDGWTLRFAVRDTGIGMPADRLDTLFQPFSQADASTTRKYGGTGLGLAISKRLCTLMGGTMSVESRVGVGTTFFFTVAVARPPVPGKAPHTPALAGRRALVVGPSATLRESLTHQLQALGLTVDSAVAPAALPPSAGAAPFDVILLDPVDPEAAAPEAPLYERYPGIPVVVLQPLGQDAPPEADTPLRLHKPVKLDRLRQALLQGLGLAPAPRPARAPDRPERPRTPLRILLAEDNPFNQKVALRMLAQLGYQADLAENGLQVLAALSRTSYDVIFLDVQMPEMDGLEAARQIRERYGDRAPCLVALTANALDDQRAACLAAGMHRYLSKPVRVETLQRVLDEVARSRPTPSRDERDGTATGTPQ